MSSATEQILARLAPLGFQTRLGNLSPFGERLPLVSGVAWDRDTAQVALVADSNETVDPGAWRQLLFAGSGLRHHLAGDRAAAFGTPVILAVVDREAKRALRSLAEDLAQNYVLFNRVDLNLVLRDDVDDVEKLDDALAPLLPRCRALLGQEISKGEVQRFWNALQVEVLRTAQGLDPMFGEFRESAGRLGATALVGDSGNAPSLPSPSPVKHLAVKNFRSAHEVDVELAPITVVHGPNGGGKTSLLEALELVWAGTSQRKPSNVSASEYARHLPRNGAGEFFVKGDDIEVTRVADQPQGELGRCVLTHEAIAGLVSESPEDRYSALLATTGLEIPDLNARTASLVAAAKEAADEALAKARLPTLPRKDSHGSRHLISSLKTDFRKRLPTLHDIVGIEEAIVSISKGAYQPRDWPPEEHAVAALIRADSLSAGLLSSSAENVDLAEAFDDARSRVGALLTPRLEAAQATRRLLDAIGAPPSLSPPPSRPAAAQQTPAPLPVDLAVRWLAHSKGVTDASARFRADAKSLDDSQWSERLRDYADALDAAVASTPDRELERLAKPVEQHARTPRPPSIEPTTFSAAGFTHAPPDQHALVPSLRELVQALQQQIDALMALDRELAGHPAREFGAHIDDVLYALCQFELARSLRREGPILRASEQLVGELLQGRLAPIVRELVAAVVRFEWYFKPLLMPDTGRKIVLGGLATSEADLDARLVLNSAERTVLGLAWFLALHMLQPSDRRMVLVLDDPTSAFDAANQAGFVSTLRAFVRLCRPEQVIIATHDDSVAAVLAEELAPVDNWPTAVARVRCQRDAKDRSVATSLWWSDASRAVTTESERLGLLDESSATT
ncbi:MAG TPA: AAA family ATPase [Thermoleophilaceae bacterium]|nr:AAA family ATPase [Thermoleophilaceae bacterium]